MKEEASKTKSTKQADNRPYRIGVALSGGGARGFAHAGALLAMEEAGLKPDVVAGVSAGSVIAVLYAAGVHPLDMVKLFQKTGFSTFTELTAHGGGFFTIEPFKRFIMQAIHPYKNLEDLPIPIYIGATDLDHGVPAVFHTGAIGDRMAASCSVPIVFRPVRIDGVNYVDGGVLRNHPAWIIRDKCQLLVGVNVSPLAEGKLKNSVLDVAMRTYNLMAKANQRTDMDLCDVSVVTPEIAQHKSFSLNKVNQLFLSGFMHMRDALDKAGMWNPDPEHSVLPPKTLKA